MFANGKVVDEMCVALGCVYVFVFYLNAKSREGADDQDERKEKERKNVHKMRIGNPNSQ